METILEYLPGIDLTGLFLAMLLVRRANKLYERARGSSKQANVSTQQRQKHL